MTKLDRPWQDFTWSPKTRSEVQALRIAAAEDDREALVALAMLSAEGLKSDDGKSLVRQDHRRARVCWERAAKLGAPDAMTRVADLLTPPGHGRRAFARAEKLYRKAFKLGESTAADNLASKYQNLGRFREAVLWHRRAEKAGSVTGSIEIARAELYGTGTRRNTRSAFARLTKLARARLGWNNWLRKEAMEIMGDALTKGWLVRRDFNRGDAWLEAAAKIDPLDYFAKR